MSTETNQEVVADTKTGEVEGIQSANEIKLSKDEYDKFKGYESTVGSLKRELKDLKKQLEERPEPKETPSKNQTEEFGLLQKTYLRSAGLSSDDEVELARDIQKKTGVEWDKLVDDDYFQLKLQKLRDAKANAAATNVEGGSASSSGGAKNEPSYWIQKGTPPTPKDVSDRKTRASIVRAMLDHGKNSGGKFYNE